MAAQRTNAAEAELEDQNVNRIRASLLHPWYKLPTKIYGEAAGLEEGTRYGGSGMRIIRVH
jgi:hypothetical protein